MARIRSYGKSDQRIGVHQTEVDCEYVVVEDVQGRYLHLSTFGSDERASARKSSQSIQLDQERAAELISIINWAFPGIQNANGRAR